MRYVHEASILFGFLQTEASGTIPPNQRLVAGRDYAIHNITLPTNGGFAHCGQSSEPERQPDASRRNPGPETRIA